MEDAAAVVVAGDVDAAAVAIARKWRALASPDAVAAATTTVTEYRAFWEAMAADRTTAAATLVWLVARVVALSFPDDRADVVEVLNGMISAGGSSATSPTASDRARGPPAARIDTRRQLLLRQPVLASIYFLTVMVPFDPYHPAVQRAMERWRDDLKTNISGGERDLFESEVLSLIRGASELETAESVNKQMLATLMTAEVSYQLRQQYNGIAPTSIKTLLESATLPSILAVSRRSNHGKALLMALLHQLMDVGNMTDTNFFHLVALIKEFLFLTRDLSDDDWLSVAAAFQPYLAWPQPFCRIATDMIQRAQHTRARRALFACVQFVQQYGSIQRSEFRERVHVLVNPNALHGLAIKDMLDDEYLQQVSFYDAVHINRCRFLHVCFLRLLADGEPVYSLRDVDRSTVEVWFNTAVDLVMKAWRSDSTALSATALDALRAVRKSAHESLSINGKALTPILDDDPTEVNTPGSTPAQFALLEDGALSIAGASVDHYPTVGSTKSLEAVLSAVATRSVEHPPLVKIVLVGGDATLQNFVCGYVTLRMQKPHLFHGIDLRVYLVPAGRRNGFTEYLAIADTWYGRNVFLLTQATLATSPNLAKQLGGRRMTRRSESDATGSLEGGSPASADLRAALKSRADLLRRRAQAPAATSQTAVSLPRAKRMILGMSPASSLRLGVDHYLRQAEHVLPVCIYHAELTLILSGAIQKRTLPFVGFLEAGAASTTMVMLDADADGKSGKSLGRTTPPPRAPSRLILPELAIKGTEVNVLGLAVGELKLPSKAYHSVVVANVPRSAQHVTTVKPHSNSLELSLFDDATRKAVRGRGTGGLDDPPVYYVSTLEIEDTVRRPFEVAIDGMVVSGVQSVRILQIKNSDGALTLPLATFTPI